MPMLAPYQPLPSSFGNDLPSLPEESPAEKIRKLLAAASPAAQAIINHAPATPAESASLGPPTDLSAAPEFQAAQAIRAALAAHPQSPGLGMAEYGAMPATAQAQVRNWIGGGQDFSAAPDEAALNTLASTPDRVNQSRVSSAIAGIDGAGGIPAGITPEDLMGDKAKWYAAQAAATPDPQDIPAADELMRQRGHYQVSPGEAPNEQPGWHASPLDAQGKAKQTAAIAADDQYRHASDAASAIRAALAQPQVTKNAQEERTMRKLRMNGPEWLLAQQNGGAYNPAAAAMFPQLGEAQLAGQHAANDTTRANAVQTEANAHSQELGFLETPMGLAQSLARAGQPVPPEIAQAAAAQALRGAGNQAGSGPTAANGAYPPSIVLSSVPQGTPPDQILETVLSHNPQPQEIPEYAKALANRGVTPAALLKMRDSITTRLGSFADSYSRIFGEDQTTKAIEDQKRRLIDQLLGQMGAKVPPATPSIQRFFNPYDIFVRRSLDAGDYLGGQLVGGPPPIPAPKRIVPKR